MFTLNQLKVIAAVNHLLEECGYPDVTVLNVYETDPDLSFDALHEAIETCPVLRLGTDDVIVGCPDSAMMKGEDDAEEYRDIMMVLYDSDPY